MSFFSTFYSQLIHLSTVLHPRYKLQYFKKNKWEVEWIREAEEVVRSAWEEGYASQAWEEEVPPSLEGTPVRCPVLAHVAMLTLLQLPDNIFADLFSTASEAADEDTDELAVYLAAPCESIKDENVLAWWRSQAQFPRLSRMAVSYLSCPGESQSALLCSLLFKLTLILTATSVDVERLFSRGRLLLSHVRNRLSTQRARALLCVGEWSRQGWVKDSDVLAADQVDSNSASDGPGEE